MAPVVFPPLPKTDPLNLHTERILIKWGSSVLAARGSEGGRKGAGLWAWTRSKEQGFGTGLGQLDRCSVSRFAGKRIESV